MMYPLDYVLNGTITDTVAQGIKFLQTKHFINPVIEKYKQHSNQDNSNLRSISAVLSTFKTTTPLPDKVYNWEPIQLPGNFTPTTITATLTIKSSEYKPKLANATFDSKGNLIEQQLQDNITESYIWDYSSTYATARVTNAAQVNIAYTSFEADGKGNWTFTGTPITDATAPTGKKTYTLGSSITKSGLSTTTTYIVSYWKKSGTVAVNGTTPITGKTINGWTYFEHKVVNPAGGLITVSGTSGIIDELRLFPLGAQMTTYTYEPLIGMTSQCDVNNRITYYEYDGFQRLILIRDQDKNIIKKICYNYAGQPEDCNCINTNANWQNTATPLRCKKNASNQNTGEQEQEQKDMNPCSVTYNQLRWTVHGTNLTACPLPATCNSSNCTGINKKCINGFCEPGLKVNTESYQSGGQWVCVYHYEWSDGSWSEDYTSYSPFACAL